MPPISITVRFRWRWPGASSAARRTSSSPTAPEPVNAIVWTPACAASAAPTSPPPGSSASAPGGSPARASASQTANAQAGDCSAGLRQTALPVASAAAVMPVAIANGKFHGAIAATTPRGL